MHAELEVKGSTDHDESFPRHHRRRGGIESYPILAGLLIAQCFAGILQVVGQSPSARTLVPFLAPHSAAEFRNPLDFIEELRTGPLAYLFARILGGLFAATLARRRKLAHVALVALGLALLDVALTFAVYRAVQLASDGIAWPWAALLKQSALDVLFSGRNWLDALAVLLGGVLAVVHGLWRRSVAGRQPWTYVTREGRSIPAFSPPSAPVAAWAWSLVGVLLLATCWIPLLALNSGTSEPGQSSLQNSLPYLLCMDVVRWGAVGLACFLVSRRFRPMSAETALRSDSRAPVVFLRSFGDDGLLAARGMGVDHLLGTLLHRTAERRLAAAVRPIGPFVAIGRPGESLPDIGAARMYVADEHWKAIVHDLTGRAGLVILQAGHTAGLQWEMRWLATHIPAEKILIFLPAPSVRSLLPWWKCLERRRREAFYQAFTSWAGPCLGIVFPKPIGDAFFLVFSKRPGRPGPWRVGRILPGRVSSPDHPLAKGLLNRLAADPVFRRPRLRWRLLRGAAFLVLAWVGSHLPAAALARRAVAETVAEDQRRRPTVAAETGDFDESQGLPPDTESDENSELEIELGPSAADAMPLTDGENASASVSTESEVPVDEPGTNLAPAAHGPP